MPTGWGRPAPAWCLAAAHAHVQPAAAAWRLDPVWSGHELEFEGTETRRIATWENALLSKKTSCPPAVRAVRLQLCTLRQSSPPLQPHTGGPQGAATPQQSHSCLRPATHSYCCGYWQCTWLVQVPAAARVTPCGWFVTSRHPQLRGTASRLRGTRPLNRPSLGRPRLTCKCNARKKPASPSGTARLGAVTSLGRHRARLAHIAPTRGQLMRLPARSTCHRAVLRSCIQPHSPWLPLQVR